MAKKAYFIGLGGAGLKTVSKLQQKLCPSGDFSKYVFTYIDTDHCSVNDINRDETIIGQNDLVALGSVNPHELYSSPESVDSPLYRRFLEWGNLESPLQYTNLLDGARGQRILGRLALYGRYRELYSHIKARLSTFNEYDPFDQTNSVPQIWVVASSCGGTGSGMLLDVLHMLNNLVQEDWNTSPDVRLVLYMPKSYIESNIANNDYLLNAFTCMWELNAFRLDYQKGHHDRFRYFSIEPIDDTYHQFPLYTSLIPIDAETSKGGLIPFQELYPAVAELICRFCSSPVAMRMIRDIGYDLNALFDCTMHPTTPFQWTRTLSPVGYMAIKKADAEFKEYAYARARYEVLNYWAKNDLTSVITDVAQAARAASEDYALLAKKFIEVSKDPMNVCLPNLGDIARGDDGSYWKEGSLFDRMYCDSIGDDLSEFAEKLSSATDMSIFEGNLKELVVEAISREGSITEKWLKSTLEEVLHMESANNDMLIMMLSDRDRIPLLFPTYEYSPRPAVVRYMYVGASEKLATQLGYVGYDMRTCFVHDETMTDRFLIIKMPIGYDFFSYKYLPLLQQSYFDNIQRVRNGECACHIHRAFAQLDIDRALDSI